MNKIKTALDYDFICMIDKKDELAGKDITKETLSILFNAAAEQGIEVVYIYNTTPRKIIVYKELSE